MTTNSKGWQLIWIATATALATTLASPVEALIEVVWVKTYEVVLVQDIVPGSDGSWPRDLTVFNGDLYFSADDGAHGRELWRYDGSTAMLVADIYPGPESGLPAPNVGTPTPMAVLDDALYFPADDGIHGRELWKYDGSTASLVADIIPGPEPGTWARHLAVFDGALYFGAYDEDHGQELWRCDGSSASLVLDLQPGSTGSWPTYMIVFDGALYFVADGGTIGRDLWRYDGSTVTLAADITDNDYAFYCGYMIEFNGELYMMNLGSLCATELCKLGVDPTPIHVDISPAKSPWSPGIFKGELYFSARDDIHGDELWKYNGSKAYLVADINLGKLGSGPKYMTASEGELYYAASEEFHGRELFAGRSLVKDIYQGGAGSHPEWLTVYNGALYFAARDADHGKELWRCRFNGLHPRIYAELRSPFKKRWEWPVDLADGQDPFAGTFAILALAEGKTPRLLARHSINLGDPRDVPQPLYQTKVLDTERMPPAMALVSVILHDASGQSAGSETEIVAFKGDLDPQAREQLEKQAQSFLDQLTVEQLRTMEIQELAVVSDEIEPPQSAAAVPWEMILIVVLILAVAVLVWVVVKQSRSS
jgi:ELWxxDGT repeat protein